jgi:arsenical pump membrane protein
LRWRYRGGIAEPVATDVGVPALTRGGRIAAAGLSVAAVLLVAASALGWPLGTTTAISGAGTLLLVAACGEARIGATLRGISWDVVPLVAGLFVLVEALDKVGVIGIGSEALRWATGALPELAPAMVGLATAFGSNLVNNLPAGLIASSVLRTAEASDAISAGALIGIDLGPNLSVTGSLATLLWLTALRRESIAVGGLAFIRIGLLVMPPALLLALAALVLQGYAW